MTKTIKKKLLQVSDEAELDPDNAYDDLYHIIPSFVDDNPFKQDYKSIEDAGVWAEDKYNDFNKRIRHQCLKLSQKNNNVMVDYNNNTTRPLKTNDINTIINKYLKTQN